MNVHGLLLAAGAGRRMGMPKALVVDEAGEPWLARAVDVLHEGGCAEVTVVLGAAVEGAVRLLDGRGADVVVAHDWAEGMSASLRTGLGSLAGGSEAALIHLVDLPDVTAAVVRRVLAAGTGPAGLARAAYDGTPGHPVLLGRDHWEPVASAATADRGARAYLRDRDVQLVECGDLATGRDVDVPS
ncbi:nucleotidyltransferase family protein [Nocardioides dongkuii]|uniref:nucleotidyltransferase family protein n=1 Tax=Nocardioides dongkuii TaxID=2760089 RepID=UPI0015FA5793|nr:nucleotidyltransferase family protein [Nocardioides dongkuii]